MLRRLAGLLLLLATSTCWMPPLAPAAPVEYATPDVADWFGTLRQPDSPTALCCGEGDAYYSDRVDVCRPLDPADCALIAIITDTRSDAISLVIPDGSTKEIVRPHVAPGTRVAVPRSKLRKFPVSNPTEHTVIFLGVVDGVVALVHCYEPLGGL